MEHDQTDGRRVVVLVYKLVPRLGDSGVVSVVMGSVALRPRFPVL